MDKNSSIYIAGHNGLVGSAIKKALEKKGYENLITRQHSELDLTDQGATALFFEQTQPEYVILAAARVGGIIANHTYRAQFIYENLQIQNNVMHSAWKTGVKKLLFLGSSCIYPRNSAQPMKEDCLLTGELEYTNEPYAIAKIAGIKTCESYNLQYGTNFVAVMPTNLYGPNDNYHLENSHVLPAMLRKFYLAHCLEQADLPSIRKDLQCRPVHEKDGNATDDQMIKALSEFGINKQSDGTVEIKLWGTGAPLREFMFVSDMADACVHVLENVSFGELAKDKGREIRNTHINIGTGNEVSIKQLAEKISRLTGFGGKISFDASRPDGTPRKLLDVSKLKDLGWTSQVSLDDGLKITFEHYLKSLQDN